MITTQPKLKYEHVHLNSYSKTRVDLAVQVSNITSTVIYTKLMSDVVALW